MRHGEHDASQEDPNLSFYRERSPLPQTYAPVSEDYDDSTLASPELQNRPFSLEGCMRTKADQFHIAKRAAIGRFLDLREYYHLTSTAVRADAKSWTPRRNLDQNECFLPLFLCHASLYILADKYAIEELRKLSLSRLHGTLYKFKVFPARLADLASLTKFIYDRTASNDSARIMLKGFWACFVEEVCHFDEFKNLIRTQAEFAIGLMRSVTRRLT